MIYAIIYTIEPLNPQVATHSVFIGLRGKLAFLKESDLEFLASLPCLGARAGRTGCGHPLYMSLHHGWYNVGPPNVMFVGL